MIHVTAPQTNAPQIRLIYVETAASPTAEWGSATSARQTEASAACAAGEDPLTTYAEPQQDLPRRATSNGASPTAHLQRRGGRGPFPSLGCDITTSVLKMEVMLKLDEFESVFKSAAKERFEFSVVPIQRVAVFTDLSADEARLFGRDVAEFLSCLGEVELETVSGERFGDVGSLLDVVEELRPDLIVSYRNLHGRARNFPFSLGSHIDVLTQATSTPVMLLPAPTLDGRLDPSCRQIQRVMVLTDHLTGSARLVNYGLALTPRGGSLVLTHLEDDTTFKRYIDVISKIPGIDTSEAEISIKRQLLKEPHDYISSCREELLSQDQLDLEVLKEVRMGHHVSDCRELVSAHGVELIVMNTKDDEQLAMHGLAYPLAIELRDIPLLLL